MKICRRFFAQSFSQEFVEYDNAILFLHKKQHRLLSQKPVQQFIVVTSDSPLFPSAQIDVRESDAESGTEGDTDGVVDILKVQRRRGAVVYQTHMDLPMEFRG